MTELLLEPINHPITAVNLHLYRVVTRNCGRIGWNQRNGFDVFPVGNIDRGGSAVAQTPGIGLETSGSNDFTGFVGSCGHEGQPFWNAGFRRRLRSYGSKNLTGRNKGGQNGGVNKRQYPPFPVPSGGPTVSFVVERNVADLAAYRIGKFSGEAIGQIPG